ncbi:hypothetical protein D3C81_1345880 [compost metagenome]
MFFVLIISIYLKAQVSKQRAKTHEEESKQRMNKFKKNIVEHGLQVSKKYISADMETAILLDEQSQKLGIMYSKMKVTKTYAYKDILEVEIVEDGTTLIKTSRGSQLGGAILGGAIAGGVGA